MLPCPSRLPSRISPAPAQQLYLCWLTRLTACLPAFLSLSQPSTICQTRSPERVRGRGPATSFQISGTGHAPRSSSSSPFRVDPQASWVVLGRAIASTGLPWLAARQRIFTASSHGWQVLLCPSSPTPFFRDSQDSQPFNVCVCVCGLYNRTILILFIDAVRSALSGFFSRLPLPSYLVTHLSATLQCNPLTHATCSCPAAVLQGCLAHSRFFFPSLPFS